MLGFFLQTGLWGLQGDDKARNNKVDVNRWIISADNLLHHSFSSCFAFNVDEGVRSIIVSVKGRRRGTKNQLRPQICITATIYPVQSIVNCDLTPLHHITASFCCQLSVLPCIEIALFWDGVKEKYGNQKNLNNHF